MAIVGAASTIVGVVKKGAFYDSVTLMGVARHVQGLPGVVDAAVVMGTAENRAILAAAGLLAPEFGDARDTDLLVALALEGPEHAEAALAAIEERFEQSRKAPAAAAGEVRAGSLDGAVRQLPTANLALISVAGRYAADEAEKALAAGLNVLLFSDNVPLEREIALKQLARDKGLLIMGPDCGTAIVSGVPLAFANVVARGGIGVVGAAGTGVQEVTTLISNAGGGISHALGTGGRDVKEAVGGLTFVAALEALAADPATKVILAVSKPPDPAVQARIEESLRGIRKPAITLFLGAPRREPDAPRTLEEAALQAVALERGEDPGEVRGRLAAQDARIDALAREGAGRLEPGRKYLRGLFSGGTFCYEAQVLLQGIVLQAGGILRSTGHLAPGSSLHSNAPFGATFRLADSLVSKEHTVVDLGEDEFTQGRPHPMIDYSLRLRRLAQEAADPEVAVVLLDVVLGYGSHLDPAAELAPAIRDASRTVAVVCSVTGTDHDPQNRTRVAEALREAGAIVMGSNAAACKLTGRIASLAGDTGAWRRWSSTSVVPEETDASASGSRRERLSPESGETHDKGAPGAPARPGWGTPGPQTQGPARREAPGSATVPPAPRGGSSTLLSAPLAVINLGLESFRDSLAASGTPSIQVDWRPPLEVDPEARATVRAHFPRIAEANRKATDIILRGMPQLVGLAQARDAIPGMTEDTLLHAGPPITWERMCGPMRGAVIGALLYERRSSSPAEAEELAASGAIHFAPCHEHAAVGPMAGVVSPSMPVFIVRNAEFGNLAHATVNEGLGKVLRYGAFDQGVIRRLGWIQDTLYPALRKAVEQTGPIDLKNLIAQALHMGDEVHNRNRAATSLLFRLLAPALARTSDGETAAQVLEFIHGNDHFFLNLSMAASKAMLDAARDIPGSSIAVVMARNGTDFGVQLAGTGSAWFTGPAEVPDALYFPGFSKADANPDIGDSAITETCGLGGFAIAASPAIVQFVGGGAADAIRYTTRMYEIAAAENAMYQIPSLDFRGTPTGIDVVQVVEKNILPFIDTGVAHKEPGIGQVGAGILNAPAEPFRKAYEGLARSIRANPG